MTEEIKFKEVENGCKVSVPLFTNLELEELDYNIKTHYDEIIKRISETVSRNKDIIVLKRVIQKQDTEINKLNNVIDRMAEDIEKTNKSLEDEGYLMETFWLDRERIKEYFMKEDK